MPGAGTRCSPRELTSIAAVTQMPQLTGVEHRFVDAGGLRTHVAEAGEGDPLVLLHGWPQHWYMWRRVIPELAKRYRVIAPDLRGFGWSDAPDHGYEKENMADDVVHLLDALGLDRVRLAGHDWGGWIGFLLCLRNPERVDRYLALNIPPPWGEISARGALDLWRFWYQVVMAAPGLGSRLLEDRPHFFKRLLRYSVNNPSTWTDRELNVFLKPLREPARARASSLIYRTWLLNELVPIIGGRYRSSRLTTPTLLLFGTHDKAITPRMIRGYEPYADDLRVEFVESSGHFIAEEVPQLVLDRALEFFAADDGRAASAAAEATGA